MPSAMRIILLLGRNSVRNALKLGLGISCLPKELVDVVSTETNEAAKDYQHIVDVMLAKDRVGRLLSGGHRFADGCNAALTS